MLLNYRGSSVQDKQHWAPGQYNPNNVSNAICSSYSEMNYVL